MGKIDFKIMGYCMRCKAKRDMVNVETFKMKPRGQPAVRGNCVKCNTKMVKILTKDERAKAGM